MSLRKENANEEPVVFNHHIYNYKPEKKKFLISQSETPGGGGYLRRGNIAEQPDSVAQEKIMTLRDQVCRDTFKESPTQLYFCTYYFKLQNCLLIIYKKLRVQKMFALAHFLCYIT